MKRLAAVEPAAKTVFTGFNLSDTGKAVAKHAVAVATKAVSNCEDMLNQMDSGSGKISVLPFRALSRRILFR